MGVLSALYCFYGTWVSITNPGMFNGIQIGDVFSGTYSYRLDLVDSNPDSTIGLYDHNGLNHEGYGIRVKSASVEFGTKQDEVLYQVQMYDDYMTTHDAIYIGSAKNEFFSTENYIRFSNGNAVGMSFEDDTAEALSSTNIIEVPIDVRSFPTQHLLKFFAEVWTCEESGSCNWVLAHFIGEISSIIDCPTPTPSPTLTPSPSPSAPCIPSTHYRVCFSGTHEGGETFTGWHQYDLANSDTTTEDENVGSYPYNGYIGQGIYINFGGGHIVQTNMLGENGIHAVVNRNPPSHMVLSSPGRASCSMLNEYLQYHNLIVEYRKLSGNELPSDALPNYALPLPLYQVLLRFDFYDYLSNPDFPEITPYAYPITSIYACANPCSPTPSTTTSPTPSLSPISYGCKGIFFSPPNYMNQAYVTLYTLNVDGSYSQISSGIPMRDPYPYGENYEGWQLGLFTGGAIHFILSDAVDSSGNPSGNVYWYTEGTPFEMTQNRLYEYNFAYNTYGISGYYPTEEPACPSPTATVTGTPSSTSSQSITQTRSQTPSQTGSQTSSKTITQTGSQTQTPSQTPSFTSTPSPSASCSYNKDTVKICFTALDSKDIIYTGWYSYNIKTSDLIIDPVYGRYVYTDSEEYGIYLTNTERQEYYTTWGHNEYIVYIQLTSPNRFSVMSRTSNIIDPPIGDFFLDRFVVEYIKISSDTSFNLQNDKQPEYALPLNHYEGTVVLYMNTLGEGDPETIRIPIVSNYDCSNPCMPTPSPSVTTSSTSSNSATFSDTPSRTVTTTNTPSNSATFSDTSTPTNTMTQSMTVTNTQTPTNIPTLTTTPTPSASCITTLKKFCFSGVDVNGYTNEGYWIYDLTTPNTGDGSLGLYEYTSAPSGIYVSTSDGKEYYTDWNAVSYQVEVSTGTTPKYVRLWSIENNIMYPLGRDTYLQQIWVDAVAKSGRSPLNSIELPTVAFTTRDFDIKLYLNFQTISPPIGRIDEVTINSVIDCTDLCYTPTPTASFTPSSSQTFSDTPTGTDTPSSSPSSSNTPTGSDTSSKSPSTSNTPTFSDTPTGSDTSSKSPSTSNTPTFSDTPTGSDTSSKSP